MKEKHFTEFQIFTGFEFAILQNIPDSDNISDCVQLFLVEADFNLAKQINDSTTSKKSFIKQIVQLIILVFKTVEYKLLLPYKRSVIRLASERLDINSSMSYKLSKRVLRWPL